MAVATKLLLSGPSEFHEGYCASIYIHPKKDCAVIIYSGGAYFNQTLSYAVGNVDKKGSAITWGFPGQMSGDYPSIAIIERDDQFYVIEVHCSSGPPRKCFFRVGRVNEADRSIEWGQAISLGYGFKPKVCAKDDGTVIILKEKIAAYGLLYRIGNVNIDNRNIDWPVGVEFLPFNDNIYGVEPTIALCEGMVVIAIRTYRSTLKYWRASINDNKLSDLKELESLQEGGVNPSVSINSKGYIVESHEANTWFSNRIFRKVGKIRDSQIDWSPESALAHTLGKFSSISLAEDGHVLEVHKSDSEKKLLISQGMLRERGQDDH